MKVQPLSISEVILITPERFGDHRGFFSETWNSRRLKQAGIDTEFVQDNHSLSASKGVLRGLHYQKPPHAQAKLVRCSRGRILDVAVDIRRSSPTFGKYVSAELSAENWSQLFVPAGFAHGFVTLEPDCEVQYKTSDYYAPECDAAIRWNDPEIGVDWQVDLGSITLSEKDLNAPLLSEIELVFE